MFAPKKKNKQKFQKGLNEQRRCGNSPGKRYQGGAVRRRALKRSLQTDIPKKTAETASETGGAPGGSGIKSVTRITKG